MSDNSLREYSKPKKIDPTRVDWNVYKEIVDTDFQFYQKSIKNLSEHSSLQSLNEAVDILSNSLYNAASTSSTRNSSNRNMETIEKGEVFKLADKAWESFRQGSSNFEACRSARNDAINHLKNVISAKEHADWHTMLTTKDSKLMWSRINWKGVISNENSDSPELKDLCDHFKAKSQITDNSTLLCEVTGKNYVEMLDKNVDLDEIQSAMKILKEDRISGDGWTSAPVAVLYAFQIIFNVIIHCTKITRDFGLRRSPINRLLDS